MRHSANSIPSVELDDIKNNWLECVDFLEDILVRTLIAVGRNVI